MILIHHPDYTAANNMRRSTLCNLQLDMVLSKPEEHALAAPWCDIEKVSCPVCAVKRIKLEQTGDWPEQVYSDS